MKYDIVVPVHNEAEHIEAFVARFLEDIPEAVRAVLHEVILVENGSTDGSLAACQRLETRFPEVVRVLSIARGSYGEAIKHGMLNSTGSHLSILECDFLVPAFVAHSIRLFETDEADFIVASKRHPESSDRRPLKRRVLTQAFNRVLNAAIGYPGSDTHGLKSIRTELARELCAQAQTTDEIFQTEIAIIAWRTGYRIRELPIAIEELRPATVSIRKRLPKVAHMVSLLRRSAKRFPHGKAQPIVQVRTKQAGR